MKGPFSVRVTTAENASAVTALLVLGGPLLTVSILNVLPFSWPSETEFVTAPWPILFAPSGVAVTVWGLLRHRCSRVSYPSHRWLATALVVCVLTGLAALGAYTRWTMFPLVLLAWPGLVVMGPVWPNGHHHYGPLASQYGAYVVALASGVGWTLFGLSIRQLWRRDG